MERAGLHLALETSAALPLSLSHDSAVSLPVL